jgi:hypothetical protein
MTPEIKEAIAGVGLAIERVNAITKHLPDESGKMMLCLSVQDGAVTYTRLGDIHLCAAALLSAAKKDPKLREALLLSAGNLVAGK